MSHPKQVEASMAARRAIVYKKIAAVLDTMPTFFQAVDLYRAAGINNHNHPGHRILIATVLEQDFKCSRLVLRGGKKCWRKPYPEESNDIE